MTQETTISLSFLMTIALFIFTSVNFFAGRKNATKKESEQALEGSKELLKANIKLEQICATTNETRADIKSMNTQIDKINEAQIKQGMEIKAIWKNIDQLKEEKEK